MKTKLSLKAIPRNGNGKLRGEGDLFKALETAQVGCQKVVRGKADRKGITPFTITLHGSPDSDRMTKITTIARQALGAHRVSVNPV